MSALPTPSRANTRPLALRPDFREAREARGAEMRTSTPPRRAPPQPRCEVTDDRRSASKLGRLWKAALLASVAGASAFGVVKVAHVVEHTDALPLRAVVITGVPEGSARAGEIRAWSELEEGVPFFGIDTAAVAARVERHPFVGHATVRRLPPDTLEIAIEERVARAALRTPSGIYLVDDDGEVMKRARPGDALDLPVLSLRTAQSGRDMAMESTVAVEPAAAVAGSRSSVVQALALLRAAEAAFRPGRLSEVIELEATGFELVLDDGARVRVGDNDFGKKLGRLAATEARLKAHGRGFSFMWLDDARHPERVAVRLRSTTETSSGGG